ncbi:hypothetical protein N2152v2_007649 [Parachlorella kessleri]
MKSGDAGEGGSGGHPAALRALEQESRVIFVDEKLPQGSELLKMVYEHVSAKLSASLREKSSQQAHLQQIEEELLRGGTGGYPQHLLTAISLPANCICLACWPSQRMLAVGLGDGSLRLCSYEGEVLGSLVVSSSGVLSVAIHPDGSSGSFGSCIAVGCMDGTVCLVSIANPAAPQLVSSLQPHKKYVVVLKFSPDGKHLVSGSWDHTFVVMTVSRRAAATADAAAAASGGGGGSDETLLQAIHTEQCGAQVQHLEFLPGSGQSREPPCFLVAVKGSNYLRQYTLAPPPVTDSSGSSGGGGGNDGGRDGPTALGVGLQPSLAVQVKEIQRINMNAVGDDYVSFSACHLAVSPGAGELLLVSADNGRILVLEAQEQFHQFAAVWDSSGHYVLAAAAHGWVYVFDVATARVVANFKAHDKNVRGLAYDAANNLLLTCSFDRTTKVFSAGQD